MNRILGTYSDKELLMLLKSNKREADKAFSELYYRYSPRIHAYCVTMINDRDQAEDIFQETFIRFYNQVNPDYDATNVPGYLMTIARHLCLNYKRDKHRTVPIEDMENVFIDLNEYEKNEMFDLIMRAVDLLDDKFKDAFVLREISGFLYTEIADITNTSVTNAKTRVARAREKLIEILEPYLKEMMQ